MVIIPAAWQLALAGASPNPSRGGLRVSFTLPDDRPATLQVFDVNGRRVAGRAVGALGAGPQFVSFENERLAAGIYLVRLSQMDRVLTVRAVVIP
jgi:hypothetical protein